MPLQGNILQFYPSAYLYKPVDDILEVKYGLNDLSAIKGSVVGVSVTSDTLNDVRVCFVKMSIHSIHVHVVRMYESPITSERI